jgi:chromosome segregation ATPase
LTAPESLLNYKLFEKDSTAVNSYFLSFLQDFRTVISSLEAFASQFTSLEADKVHLQKEVESTSSKLDNAVKMAAEACQNADSLKEELEKLRNKLKDEEALKLAVEAQRNEKDNLLRQSILVLLSNSHLLNFQLLLS